jgi:hypothetical protein
LSRNYSPEEGGKRGGAATYNKAALRFSWFRFLKVSGLKDKDITFGFQIVVP